jgi:hypothetical protein
MKRILLILTFLQTFTAFAQQAAFKPLRYDEDYSALKTDTSSGWYSRMKYLPLSRTGNTWLSFGGEVRYQYFHFTNEDWGDAPKDKDGFILTRYLGHADLHVGKHFRTFVQLQSSLAGGKVQSPSPVDENQLDLHQAFFDVMLPLKENQTITLRMGRQEMMYGSQRLVSVREAPNNRQAFDAAKLIYQSKRLRADAFYSYYVTAKKEIFDDKLSSDIRFWGAHAAFSQVPFLHNIDAYYFGLWKAEAEYDDGTGRERRHSIGTRVWKRSSDWQYDFEGVYQWGKLADNNISAWTLSSNTSYIFSSTPLKPELGLKAELISGDKDHGDGRLQTFNPLFPKGAYFGLAALIGPSNLADAHPYLNLKLSKELSWQTDYDLFWRMSGNDGIYGPNARMIYTGKNTTSTEIGQQLGTSLEYTPNPFLYFRAEFTWFKAGKYLKEVSAGRDILMAGATMQLKF